MGTETVKLQPMTSRALLPACIRMLSAAGPRTEVTHCSEDGLQSLACLSPGLLKRQAQPAFKTSVQMKTGKARQRWKPKQQAVEDGGRDGGQW